MRVAILIIILISSIFYLSGCVVISCEEHRHQKRPHVECSKTDLMVHEVHVIGF
jgi:hypothetical protein